MEQVKVGSVWEALDSWCGYTLDIVEVKDDMVEAWDGNDIIEMSVEQLLSEFVEK